MFIHKWFSETSETKKSEYAYGSFFEKCLEIKYDIGTYISGKVGNFETDGLFARIFSSN